MIEGKDVLSFFIGLVLFLMGLLPMLNSFGIGPDWMNFKFLPVAVFSWIVAVGGLYLVINSIIEITNSSSIGYLSIMIAFVCLTIGVLPILFSFGIGPSFFALDFLGAVSKYIYYVIFMAEGAFLMYAMIAMEM